MLLAGQVAIITGSSRGIGKATAVVLAKEGAGVVILSRSQLEVQAAASDLEGKGYRVLPIKADAREIKDVQAVAARTIETFGRVDILVNNAAVAYYKPVVETSESEWDEMIDVNLKGMFLFSKAVLPFMMEQKYGRIINISSGLGKSGYPNLAAYSASKFGVLGFTESLAIETKDYNIRVYAVCPGGVATPMHLSIFPEDNPRFLLPPEAVAQVILKLVSPSCKQRSGTSIDVY